MPSYTLTVNKGYKIPTVGALAADWPNYIKETIEAIDADLVGSIIPDADNTRDLGSTDKRYHAIHVNEVRAATLYGNGANLTGITGATGGIANAGSTTIGADTDSSGDGVLSLQTRQTDRLVIANNGKVGIGIASPNANLHIEGSDGYTGVKIQDSYLNKFFNLQHHAAVDGAPIIWHSENHSEFWVNGVQILALKDGKVGIGTTMPTISGSGKLHLAGDTIRLDTARTPASAAAAGNQGEVGWDVNYIYICVATNSWKRSAITAW